MKRARNTVRPVTHQADSSQLERATELSAPSAPLFQHSLENIAVHAPSQRLEAGLQSSMESSFGASFADVRVAELPSVGDLGAQALTHGSNLYFQPGAFNPGSLAGRELIGHELAHVVQQRGGAQANRIGGRGLSFNSSLESEADGAGAAAARGMSVNVSAGSASGLGVQAKFGSEMLNKVKNFFGYGSKKSAAPEAQPDAPLEAEPAQPKFDTIPLKPEYRDEQVAFPGGNRSINERTRYLTDEERPEYKLSFEDGLARRDGGGLKDTSDAERSGNLKGKAGRNLFTMDESGGIYAADGMAEWQKDYTQHFHHSSLAQGKGVAGAGELEIDEGHIRTISDQSGHYQPKAEQTLQVVQQLESQGALRDTTTDDSGKAVNRAARVELQGKPAMASGENDGERWSAKHKLWKDDISLSSDQFLQTGGNEKQIRQKIGLTGQINSLQSADESENTPSQVLARAKAQRVPTPEKLKPQWMRDLEQSGESVAPAQAPSSPYNLTPAEVPSAYNRTPNEKTYSFSGEEPQHTYLFSGQSNNSPYGVPIPVAPLNSSAPQPLASPYSMTPADLQNPYQFTPINLPASPYSMMPDLPPYQFTPPNAQSPYQMTPANLPASPYQRTPAHVDSPYQRTPAEIGVSPYQRTPKDLK